jgi:hypothetical protein
MRMDHILHEASGASKWDISVGINFMKTAIIYTQLFVLFEGIAYVILFKKLRDYNQKAENRNLGLSKKTLNRRNRKNVISFVGEFVSFIIESSCTITVAVAYNSTNYFVGSIPIIGMVFQAGLYITFFVASPELRRFYFC